MRQAQKRVICLVEKNWEGIRKLTVALASEKVPSVCIIKGRLEKEVLEMITKYDEISLISIRRWIFRMYIFVMFLRNFLLQNTICVVTNGKKNYPWVSAINRVLGIKTLLLVEESHDSMLFSDGKPQGIEFTLNLAKKQR